MCACMTFLPPVFAYGLATVHPHDVTSYPYSNDIFHPLHSSRCRPAYKTAGPTSEFRIYYTFTSKHQPTPLAVLFAAGEPPAAVLASTHCQLFFLCCFFRPLCMPCCPSRKPCSSSTRLHVASFRGAICCTFNDVSFHVRQSRSPISALFFRCCCPRHVIGGVMGRICLRQTLVGVCL